MTRSLTTAGALLLTSLLVLARGMGAVAAQDMDDGTMDGTETTTSSMDGNESMDDDGSMDGGDALEEDDSMDDGGSTNDSDSVDDGGSMDGGDSMDDGSTDESDMGSGTESMDDMTETVESDGQPRFGVVVALLAFVGALLAVRHRR